MAALNEIDTGFLVPDTKAVEDAVVAVQERKTIPIDNTVERMTIEHCPAQPFTDAATGDSPNTILEFYLRQNGTEFVDLRNTYLELGIHAYSAADTALSQALWDSVEGVPSFLTKCEWYMGSGSGPVETRTNLPAIIRHILEKLPKAWINSYGAAGLLYLDDIAATTCKTNQWLNLPATSAGTHSYCLGVYTTADGKFVEAKAGDPNGVVAINSNTVLNGLIQYNPSRYRIAHMIHIIQATATNVIKIRLPLSLILSDFFNVYRFGAWDEIHMKFYKSATSADYVKSATPRCQIVSANLTFPLIRFNDRITRTLQAKGADWQTVVFTKYRTRSYGNVFPNGATTIYEFKETYAAAIAHFVRGSLASSVTCSQFTYPAAYLKCTHKEVRRDGSEMMRDRGQDAADLAHLDYIYHYREFLDTVSTDDNWYDGSVDYAKFNTHMFSIATKLNRTISFGGTEAFTCDRKPHDYSIILTCTDPGTAAVQYDTITELESEISFNTKTFENRLNPN